jgi:hypothetical protein
MKHKTLVDIIDKHIDNMFEEVGIKYKLTSGDFTPDQDHTLDDIKVELYFLLTAYINQNLKD